MTDQPKPPALPAKAYGRPIAQRVVNIGIGGQIKWDEAWPNPWPEGDVEFQGVATFHKAADTFEDGKVNQQIILTVKAAEFEVTATAPPPPKPVQGTLGEAEPDGE